MKNMNMKISDKQLCFSHVFSYWIFIWYIFHLLRVIPYSPKLALLLGIIVNVIMLFVMMYNNVSRKRIFILIFFLLVMKGLPFYTLKRERIRIKKDLCVLAIVFLLYFVYYVWTKPICSLDDLMNHSTVFMRQGKQDNEMPGPGMVLLNKVCNYFHIDISY